MKKSNMLFENKVNYFRIMFCILILMSMILSVSCKKENKLINNPVNNTNTSNTPDKSANLSSVSDNASTIIKDEYALNFSQEELDTYNKLFDLSNKISIEIDISDDELLKMENDYERYASKGSKSPIYRMADNVIIRINNEVFEIEEVGVRMKGNTSRMNFYSKSKGIYNLVNFRLSFDETFDDENYYGEDAKVWENDELRNERKQRTFATLESLEMKWNKIYDNTYVREYYSHQMFKDYGVLCANMNLCVASMADVDYGVFKIYEPIDNTFLERNLPANELDGDLYKCGWLGNNCGSEYTTNINYGVVDEENGKYYNYDLKTNKKKSNHESLLNLLKTLNSSTVTKENFESVVDMDYWVNFAATSYYMGNPDDMRNNFNNHYVYFLKSSGKAIFIPYDNDRVLGLTSGWNPTGNGLTEASPYSQWAQGAMCSQINPLYTHSVCRGGYYTQEYRTTLINISTSKWMNISNFMSYYNIAKKLYEADVSVSKNFDNVEESKFYFNNDTNTAVSSDWDNMSTDVYISLVLNTIKNKIDDYDIK